MTTDKQLPVIPVLGNAFAEQAYRDSMKAAEAARSAIGQDKSKSKKDPQVPQVRSVERDSSGSEKKSGTSKSFFLFSFPILKMTTSDISMSSTLVALSNHI